MTEARLTADLENAALRALKQAWQEINWQLFAQTMKPATMALTDALSVLARWDATHRTIEFSRKALLTHSWGAVMEVLKHEMAHQYVWEVLGVRDESAHGPVFRKVCEDRGIDPKAAGVPDAKETPSEHVAVLEKIAKLLALAESPNEHEAQNAMNAAQRLMLKHNLEAVSKRSIRAYSYRHLGEASARVDESARLVAAILQEHFFVETLWVSVWRVEDARSASVLEVCGTDENLSMAEYVHSFLHHTAEALWRAHKREQKIAGDRDRRAYRAGVMQGFREKLEAERTNNQERGLVWVGDPELRGYFRKRYPHIKTVYRSGSGSSEARQHGREAGRNLVLHKGVSAGGASGGAPRQLGSGRSS